VAGDHELGVVQAGLDVLHLQIRVLGKDLFGAHTRTQQVDDHLHGPTHPTHARLAMADAGGYGDTAKL